MRRTRKIWSRHVLETEGYLYAVQALRNAITANTFLASTSITLFTFTAGYFNQVLKQAASFDVVTVVQFTSMLALLLASAYSFSQSARLMTHATFMFPVVGKDNDACNVHVSDCSEFLTSETIEDTMMRSEDRQWLGLRYLYLAFSVVIWILGGEWAFLFTSTALTRFFAKIDGPPNGLGNNWAS